MTAKKSNYHKAAQKLEMWPIAKLRPNPRNSRTHSAEQVAELARSISKLGFNAPVVAMPDGLILAGHGRTLAAKSLGLTEVPVVVVEHMSAEEARAYVIADNRMGEKAAWDNQILIEELRDLESSGIGMEISGFTENDLAGMLQEGEKVARENTGRGVEDTDADRDWDLEQLRIKWDARPGQLWQIGQHRLLIGDATSPADLERLMDGRKAHMVHTDPPYGVSYQDSGGRALAGDEKRDDALLVDLLRPALRLAMLHTVAEPAFYVWYASSSRRDFFDALDDVGLVEIAPIIWAKPAATLSWAHYRWDYEPCIYAGKQGRQPPFYGDRTQTLLWFLGVGTAKSRAVSMGKGVTLIDGEGGSIHIGPGEDEAQRKIRVRQGEQLQILGEADDSNLWLVKRDRPSAYAHPTQKPAALPLKAIKNSSRPGEIVLDLFLGSGSTMAAAQASGRICYGTEIDPKYAAGILERMSEMGLKPSLEAGSSAPVAG